MRVGGVGGVCGCAMSVGSVGVRCGFGVWVGDVGGGGGVRCGWGCGWGVHLMSALGLTPQLHQLEYEFR